MLLRDVLLDSSKPCEEQFGILLRCLVDGRHSNSQKLDVILGVFYHDNNEQMIKNHKHRGRCCHVLNGTKQIPEVGQSHSPPGRIQSPVWSP